jgi:hypothetical protein
LSTLEPVEELVAEVNDGGSAHDVDREEEAGVIAVGKQGLGTQKRKLPDGKESDAREESESEDLVRLQTSCYPAYHVHFGRRCASA